MDKYASYDNDAVLGKKFPSLATLQSVTNVEERPLPKEGEVFVALFWGQYHKPGYKFLPMYSALDAKLDGFKVVSISVDPEISYPTKFMEDPAKKYSTKFETTMAVAWDEKQKIKGEVVSLQRTTLSVPHAFLVNKEGIVVWHQNHSQIGATAPTYMDKMEAAIDATLKGEPVAKVGDRPKPAKKQRGSDSDSDSDEEPEEEESSSDEEGDENAKAAFNDFFA